MGDSVKLPPGRPWLRSCDLCGEENAFRSPRAAITRYAIRNGLVI